MWFDLLARCVKMVKLIENCYLKTKLQTIQTCEKSVKNLLRWPVLKLIDQKPILSSANWNPVKIHSYRVPNQNSPSIFCHFLIIFLAKFTIWTFLKKDCLDLGPCSKWQFGQTFFQRTSKGHIFVWHLWQIIHNSSKYCKSLFEKAWPKIQCFSDYLWFDRIE